MKRLKGLRGGLAGLAFKINAVTARLRDGAAGLWRGSAAMAARIRGGFAGLRRTSIPAKAWAGALGRFWARRGFYVLAALCLALVAGAAVYARGRIASPPAGQSGRAPAAAAAAPMATAAPERTASPAPTAAPAPLVWPVSGRTILRGYADQPAWFEPLGVYETHPGVDIQATLGEEVAASADGTVSFAGFDPQRGYMVETRGADGLIARYGNLSKDFLVSPGGLVRRGQPLGAVGASAPSAAAAGPFLHFEAFRGGARVALP